MTPLEYNKFSIINLVRILTIEVKVHHILGMGREEFTTKVIPPIFNSFSCECRQIAITFLHMFLQHVSLKLLLEKNNILTNVG
jgi:hypothetical protein